MGSKKTGAMLALAFIVGLSGFTLYSRAYAERKKPLVHLMYAESGSFFWEYETHGTIEPAAEEYAKLGIKWTIEAILPRSAWERYMDGPVALVTHVVAQNEGHPERVEIVRTELLENGDTLIIYSYTAPHRQTRLEAGTISAARAQVWPGETAAIHMAPAERFVVSDTLLPPAAVHRDASTGGYYIFSVTRRENAWGYEYVANRHNVQKGLPNHLGGMANLMMIPTSDPIVAWSDRAISDGDVVRIFD